MIKQATPIDKHVATSLAQKLWPGHEENEMAEVIINYIKSNSSAIFITYDAHQAVGIAISNLRTDYVEGAHSSPVGYLEGIYILPTHQRQGLAKQLLTACETWAKQKGCTEFASDCELNNIESLNFHLSLGFKEANRIICFTKTL